MAQHIPNVGLGLPNQVIQVNVHQRPAETMFSQRGGRLLIVDKYLFRSVIVSGNVNYWRCNTVACAAVARTDLLGPNLVTSVSDIAVHDHCNDSTVIARKQFKAAVKQGKGFEMLI